MSKNREIYITIGDFAFLQGIGRPYEGFVVGLGYAYVGTVSVNPPNFNGYSHAGKVPPQLNRFTLLHNQYVDNSPEMIQQSMNGITPNGAILYTVERGDTLTSIARKYRVSINDIVRWNRLDNPDKIQIGQKLVVSEPSRDLLSDYLSKQQSQQHNYNYGSANNSTGQASRNNAYEMFKNIVAIASMTADVHGYLPKTQLYNEIYKNGQFAYADKGNVVVRSNRYHGNQHQSASSVSGLKNSFDRTIMKNRAFNAVSDVSTPVSLGIDLYDYYSGDIDEFSTMDIGVNTVATGAGVANYFYGVTIPYVGEFVMVYGGVRFGWDMGEKYGPSKWPRLYREHKRRRENERFLKRLKESLENEDTNSKK